MCFFFIIVVVVVVVVVATAAADSIVGTNEDDIAVSDEYIIAPNASAVDVSITIISNEVAERDNRYSITLRAAIDGIDTGSVASQEVIVKILDDDGVWFYGYIVINIGNALK